MMATRREFTVRRIVVAIDCSSPGQAALEAAAKLAARLNAEVQGVFVEDINLIHLSELTVGRVVHPISGLARSFDRNAIENELRSEASQVRRTLETRAGEARVTCSFRVVRGQVEAEVITAAGDADLLILGTSGRQLGAVERAGSTALAAARRAPRSVLLLRPGAVITAKPLVVYDGSEDAELALSAALRLAAGGNGAMAVVLVGGSEEEDRRRQEHVEERLAAYGIKPAISRVDRADPRRLHQLATAAGADIVVLSANDPVLADEGHRDLIESIGRPVLLVR